MTVEMGDWSGHCDFCNSAIMPKDATANPCADFDMWGIYRTAQQMGEIAFVPAGTTPPFGGDDKAEMLGNFRGPWFACSACQRFIAAGDRDRLLRRCQRLAAQQGESDLIEPMQAPQIGFWDFRSTDVLN